MPTPILPSSCPPLHTYPGPGSVQWFQKVQCSRGRGQPGISGHPAADGKRPLPQRTVAALPLDQRLFCLPVAGAKQRTWV